LIGCKEKLGFSFHKRLTCHEETENLLSAKPISGWLLLISHLVLAGNSSGKALTNFANLALKASFLETS
jgi:hypothetical protein